MQTITLTRWGGDIITFTGREITRADSKECGQEARFGPGRRVAVYRRQDGGYILAVCANEDQSPAANQGGRRLGPASMAVHEFDNAFSLAAHLSNRLDLGCLADLALERVTAALPELRGASPSFDPALLAPFYGRA